MTTTPRTASFDDLRVGQWVAVLGESFAFVGQLAELGTDEAYDDDQAAWFVTTSPETALFTEERETIGRADCDRGIVTILRDAPAPPVTVRREDYDALVKVYRPLNSPFSGPLAKAVRALIAHADTGEDA